MSNRVCCNCGNCNRLLTANGIETRCAIDNHYIGYSECFLHWCRYWEREREWDGGTDNGVDGLDAGCSALFEQAIISQRQMIIAVTESERI